MTRCVFERRSGGPAMCNAVLDCVANVGTVEAMRACTAPTMDRLIADSVSWRAAAGERYSVRVHDPTVVR